ncbi:hypothetical protein FGLOB1_6220 [Fusarium globosum]|uniref:C3H1-type domain-containing protein n=1 Tax=Fusarium globosum TaxID=78864 RepID=A0A8H6D905_9HYPO|nr:hypothetical protein FGLOB1_6220 [Fusarium globosum]
MESNQDRMPIAHNVRNVLKSFRAVATLFKHEIDSLDYQAERDLLLTLENENTRFRMWAGNLAAHQSGPASLDHRLREAPHIQEQVLYLLRDILESLEDARVLILQEMPPKGGADIENKPESLAEGSNPDSEYGFTDSDLDDDESISPNTRLSTFCTDIAEAIDCLLRLSLAIANPAPHERFRKLGAGPDEDVSFYEAHDVRYVQDKFPKISPDLPGLLGKFITRRRQFFKYREAHHAKLAAGLDQMTQKDTSRTEVVPNTVASSLPEHLKGSGVIDEDNRSDMAISETSYATSAGYLTMENGEMKPATPLKVPPRPLEADRGVFECDTSLETSARTPVSSQGVPNRTQTLIDAIDGNSTSPSITGAHGLVHLTVSYIKHVGRHLEQLALFALPSIGDEQLEDDADSGEQNDEASKLEAISADDDSFEASPKLHEQQGTDEVDDQSDISGISAMAVGHNREADVAADEVPDSGTPMLPAASSSGQAVVEPSDTDEGIEDALAKLEGPAKKPKENPIGFKEQRQLLLDPDGEVTQDSRPVYTRMSRKHLSLETLREFEVDFDFDVDPDYVLVKRWVPEWEQDRLWKHTRLIREKRDNILREGTSEQRDDEPEYEWVRERGRRETKSPSRLDDHADKPFLCIYDGSERGVPRNGFSRKRDLQDHLKRIYHNDDGSGSYSSQLGERSQSPPPHLTSVDDIEDIYVGATRRESGIPPPPFPPSQILRGPTIEREVITHYRDIDHGALPENKDTICRNVVIYGHCRYEDQGCAFSHDQNKIDSKKPASRALNNLLRARLITSFTGHYNRASLPAGSEEQGASNAKRMAQIQGYCDARFSKLRDMMEEFVASGQDIGASLCVNIDGDDVVDIWGGYADASTKKPWAKNTLVNVFSTTKLVTNLAALMLISRGVLRPEDRVSQHWPEFAANGKSEVTVGQVLAHTAGLSAWEDGMTLEDICDLREATDKLARQKTLWTPGSRMGYHGLTQGFLVGELVRRKAGMSIEEFIGEEICRPLGVGTDFQLGCRKEDLGRVASVMPPPGPSIQEVLSSQTGYDPDSIVARTLCNPSPRAEDANTALWRSSVLGSVNGHTNARALVKILSCYSLGGTCAGGDHRLLTPETVELALTEHAKGTDLDAEHSTPFPSCIY